MAIKTIIPNNEQEWLSLRSRNINSTEVSMLFNCSPYGTLFELWHKKKDALVLQIEESDIMKWGKRLQSSIAIGIAEDHGLKDIREMTEYIEDDELRIGSSFDYAIGDEGILEIKNVLDFVFKKQWSVEGDEIEAPPFIEMQLQHQLLLSKRKYGLIGAYIGGGKTAIIRREPDLLVHDAILKKCSEFWESIDRNEPPKPDFQKDSDFIIQLFQKSGGPDYDATNNEDIKRLVAQYMIAGEEIKEAEANKAAAKAQILMKIGDASKVRGKDFTISCTETAPAHVEAYERKGFRNFRINWREEK